MQVHYLPASLSYAVDKNIPVSCNFLKIFSVGRSNNFFYEISFMTFRPISPKTPWVSRNSCTLWVPGCDVTTEGLSLQTIAGCRMGIDQSTMSIRGCGPQLPGTHRLQEYLLTQGERLHKIFGSMIFAIGRSSYTKHE